MPEITPGATAFVPVTDQDEAVDFFVGALGLEKLADFDYGDAQRWVEVGPPGGLLRIAVTRRDDTRTGVETGLAFGTPDIEQAHTELEAGGASVDPIIREGDPAVEWAGATLAGTPPMFVFRDPDGNSFLLTQVQ